MADSPPNWLDRMRTPNPTQARKQQGWLRVNRKVEDSGDGGGKERREQGVEEVRRSGAGLKEEVSQLTNAVGPQAPNTKISETMDKYARGLERVDLAGTTVSDLLDLDLFDPWLAWLAGCRHDMVVDRSNWIGPKQARKQRLPTTVKEDIVNARHCQRI